MLEFIAQAIPSVENVGNAKEWIYYIVSILVSYAVGSSIAIKYLYKKNASLHDKFEMTYPNFLNEQRNFYKLYIDTTEKLSEVIKNNSLAFHTVEESTKNNILRVEELTKNMKEQSDKTLITLEKLTEKIILLPMVNSKIKMASEL